MTTEELSKIEPLKKEEAVALVAELGLSNNEAYNLTKAAEECAELVEIILKKINKAGSHREPSDQDIAEEIADVQLRTAILAVSLGLAPFVEDRIYRKCAKLGEALKSNRYENKI